MKKILISKYQEPSTSTKLPSPDSYEIGNDTKERVNFQPPLPIGPPPEDIHPKVEIKKEIFDEGYHSHSSDSSPESDPAILDENIKIKEEDPSDPRPMCKRFARGTCTKGTSCLFKHKIVLSQLKGLYKFCWDYQNKICDRPICKHVHASIFEEQNFYRTGYLPPNALAHLKLQLQTDNYDMFYDEKNEQLTQWHTPEQNSKSTNDQLLNGSLQTHRNFWKTSELETKNNMKLENKAPPTQPRKRSRSPIEESCSGLEDSSGEPLTKHCKRCDVNVFRLQISSNKMEEVMRSTVRLREKTEEIDNKATRLDYVMKGLISLEDDKSFEDFINRVVSGNSVITEKKAMEITEAVNIVLSLRKALSS